MLKVGAIALTFLVIGYQASLFMQHTLRLGIEYSRDHPDTVFVSVDSGKEGVCSAGGASRIAPGGGSAPGAPPGGLSPCGEEAAASSLPPQALPEAASPTGSSSAAPPRVVRRSASVHSPALQAIRSATRKVESFPFDPNTVSVEDLQRLGFSLKQAQSIDNYRAKGGRFRRPSDFAKSYVVSDSVFARLEPFIDIPKLDINTADSAAFDALPGIGPYFASRMVSYRERLGGYSCTEQLMEIYRFDEEKYNALKDLVICSPCEPFRLWSLPADSLRLHPHIKYADTARGIVFYREHNPRELWTLGGLRDAGIIDSTQFTRLSLCRIE